MSPVSTWERPPAATVPLGRAALIADGSLTGRAFCERHTDLVDGWLTDLFEASVADPAGVALVAVGGHGRRELAPWSDLDLLLLVTPDRGPDREGASLAEALWYPVWDAGFKLGHAVRTVRDTIRLASEDLETATALLSARHLVGDASLTAELVERARGAWHTRGARSLDALARSLAGRHARYGDVSVDLEPDLKHGRGGLRDVQAMTWAAAAGAEVPHETIARLEGPYGRLLEARVELHRVTGRPGDRLVLEEQDRVATRLGDPDASELMRRIADAGRVVAGVSAEHWYDRRQRPRRDRSLGTGLRLQRGRVRLAGGATPAAVADPATTLDVALAAARERARIEPSTLAALRTGLVPPEPWTEQLRHLFCELLLCGDAAVDVVLALDDSGIWERFVPEWAAIRCLPQRNPLHRVTVERHLLECAAEAAGLAGRTPRPDLLVLAALLHDIGKGYPGDHSRSGRHLAEGVVRRMGFTPGDVATVGFLVAHHLLLADAATRRDLDDPETIAAVADTVATTERLALLRALTHADGLATGPAAWSSWKAELVDELADRVARRLSGAPAGVPSRRPDDHVGLRGDMQPVVAGEGDRLTVVCPDRPGVFCRIAGVLALYGLDVVGATIDSDGKVASDRFRVRAGPATQIPWDRVERDVRLALAGRLAVEARLSRLARTQRPGRPRPSGLESDVRVDDEVSSRATLIEVIGPDRTGLLHHLARALVDLDLDVVSAKIDTVGGDVIDTFHVTRVGGGKVSDPAYLDEARLALLHALHPDGLYPEG